MEFTFLSGKGFCLRVSTRFIVAVVTFAATYF